VNTFERFTDRARRVLVLAQEEARLLNHAFIGTEHLLLGLIHEGDGVAAKALDSLGVSFQAARAKVVETIGKGGTAPSGSLPFTPRSKKVLELAMREANQLGHNYIGTEHLLLGLVREGEGVGSQVLVNLGADLGRVRQRVMEVMSGYSGNVGAGDRALLERANLSPLCPQCRADLVEAARFRRITVAPGPTGDHEEPISMDVVYCSGCGTTFDIFKSEPPMAGSP
jgi:ATP-dependent Clp protease ATP-binding subunit ClpA